MFKQIAKLLYEFGFESYLNTVAAGKRKRGMDALSAAIQDKKVKK